MSEAEREVRVAVAVAKDADGRYFVCWNEGWQGYAFPMRKPREGDHDLAAVAVQAFRDHYPGEAGGLRATAIATVGDSGLSFGVWQNTRYDYRLFEIEPTAALQDQGVAGHLAGLPPDGLANLPQAVSRQNLWCGWLPAEQLLTCARVTWSTQDIVAFLTDRPREVALAVVSRCRGGRREFLLVPHTGYGDFFPTRRMPYGAAAGPIAGSALEADTGCLGPWNVTEVGPPVVEYHFSPRHHSAWRYRFHVCTAELPGADLNAPHNPLAAGLESKGVTPQWVAAADLLKSGVSGLASSMEAVHDAVVRAAGPSPERPAGRPDLRGCVPAPIDTSGIELPPDLLALTERLAEHNHDVWAQQRMAEGWTWGPERNDARKEHPCLVPYLDLPESEKEYDRRTAMLTLKAIVALGYRIEKEP